MRIAILTLPLQNNYGGILQNFALQSYLKQNGKICYTLNSICKVRKYNKFRLILSIFKRTALSLIGMKSYLFLNPEKQLIFSKTPGYHQKTFIKKYIDIIDVDFPLTEDFDLKNSFDAYIVGSDQVWRPSFSPDISNYYLDFVASPKVKIAYAVSFGVDKWEADEIVTPKLVAFAKQFDLITVREESGQRICEKMFSIEPKLVLDPTLLVSKETYLSLYRNSNDDKQLGNDVACIYILDPDKTKNMLVKSICNERNFKPHIIGMPDKNGYPSIESWLNGIEKCDFVITDSFHGTVFSVIFNKPFICFDNKERGSSRFISFLKSLNLTDRLINIDEYSHEKIKKLIYREIDYPLINGILSEMRKQSQNLLIKALSE